METTKKYENRNELGEKIQSIDWGYHRRDDTY